MMMFNGKPLWACESVRGVKALQKRKKKFLIDLKTDSCKVNLNLMVNFVVVVVDFT